MKPVPLGPFLGMNTRLPEFSLTVPKQGRYLRSVDNAVFDNSGGIVRRVALSRAVALTAPHSLFEDAFLVRDSALYAVTLPAYTETLLAILGSNAPMGYVRVGDDVYFSNGVDSGRVRAGVVYPWGLSTPAAPAVVDAVGTLHAGDYLVALSLYNTNTGEEGGLSARTAATTVTGGLSVAIPAAAAGATHANVYVTKLSGSVLFLAATVALGGGPALIASAPTGREASQRFENPLPAGTRVFEFNGRLCAVAGNKVYYGLPYRYGYYSPVDGVLSFPADVSIAIGNQGGLYVAADKTYFFAGQDLAAVEVVRDVLPYGAVPGTEFADPNEARVGWFGARGIVFADTTGKVDAVMDAIVSVTPPAAGVSLVIERPECTYVMSCGWIVNLRNNMVSTYSGVLFTSGTAQFVTEADGVYAIGSEGEVFATLDFGKEKFAVDGVVDCYYSHIGVLGDGELSLSVQIPNGDWYDYSYVGYSEDLSVRRVVLGKKLRSAWYHFVVRNTDGLEFNLASMTVDVGSPITRRV